MKNISLIIGIVAIVVGTALACFTDIYNDIPALAIAAFGLGALIVSTWNKSEKKGWLVIASIVCVTIGGFCCAIASLSQDTMVKVISAVGALVLLLIGIIAPLVKSKLTK